MGPQETRDILYVQDERFKDFYKELPEERKTYNVSSAAVNADPANLAHVPVKQLNDALIKMAVQKDGLAIEHVPSDKLDKYICHIAVNQNGSALGLVPEKYRTPEVCIDAVTNNGWALEFVPDKIKTKELCRIALSSSSERNGSDHQIMTFIPYSDVCLEGLKLFSNTVADPYEVFGSINPEIMTPEIAMFGVKMDGANLGKVPKHLHTPDLYMEAVSKNGPQIRRVPPDKITPELCEVAVRDTYHSMLFVPEEMKTTELCTLALNIDAFAIRYFPADKLTHEACEKAEATASNLQILYFIPFQDIHQKVFDEQCVDYSTTKVFLESLNPEFIDQSLVNKIFEKQPVLFYLIPDEFKDKQLCEAAVKMNGKNLAYVPEDQKTKELCELAIKNGPYAIKHILDEMKGPEQYLQMVMDNANNLRGIPAEERTYLMCQTALDNTFGKDKNDFSIVGSVTFSSLLLDVFKAQTDPKNISLLLHMIDRNLITEDIAKEAMQRDGGSLFMIPNGVITREIAEIAVNNQPYCLRAVPAAVVTPEMVLSALKKTGEKDVYIPNRIDSGDNIYSFHKKVERIIDKPLSYEEHSKLYKGESIPIKNMQVGGRYVKNGTLQYDRDNNKLIAQPIGQSKDKKQEQSNKEAPRSTPKRTQWKL